MAIPPTGKPVGFLATDIMTYKELENKINAILSNDEITDKAKYIVDTIKLIEDSSTIFDVHLLPISDADGNPVKDSERDVAVFGDELTTDGDNYIILKDSQVVFQCPSGLVMHVTRR